MDTNQPTQAPADRSSIDRHALSQTEEIAISAAELVKLIESGQGNDVNELIRQVLQDRQAA